MFTTLKSLIRRLPFSNIPICYYDFKQGEHYPIYFRCIAKEYQAEYDHLSDEEKRDYVSESAQIYVPNMPIHEFSRLYKTNDKLTWDYTIDKIHKLGLQEVSDKDAEDMFALYCILHEVGHWKHFDSVGKKIWTYIQDSDKAKEVFDLQNKLKEKILSQGGAQLPIDFINERKIREKYNAVPCEKIANDYADREFGQMWKILKDL